MARGRHRRSRPVSFSRVRLALVAMSLALVGVIGCEPAAGGTAGTVVGRSFHSDGGLVQYTLDVRKASGAVTAVRLPFAPWSRCQRGDVYPNCKYPQTGRV